MFKNEVISHKIVICVLISIGLHPCELKNLLRICYGLTIIKENYVTYTHICRRQTLVIFATKLLMLYNT